MNCRSFHKRLVELVDTNPDPAATSDLLQHVEICPQCAREFAESRAVLSALNPSHKAYASSNLKERIMNKVAELETVQDARKGNLARGKLVRFVCAAALLLAIVLCGNWLATRNGGQPGSAVAVLAQAAELAGDVKTMHIKARMRTREDDNFDVLALDADFVRVEIWKMFGDPPKWRVEKPRRVAVMDGEYTLLLIHSGAGPIAFKASPRSGVVGWLTPLLDVHALLAHEQELACEQDSKLTLRETKDAAGRSKTVLTIEAKAQGDYSESDYLRNLLVAESDNTRVYTFDAATRRLEGMQVYVNTDSGQVLVFEATAIEYDMPVEPSLFALNVPENATWYVPPYEMADVPDNSTMTPREAAEAIFTAMADEDWDTLRGFAGSMFDSPDCRKLFGGLRIISIGEPFRSGMYPGWFVPYEIQVKSGGGKKHNLAIRNDNPKQQWVLDGGF